MNNTYLCHHGIKGQKWGIRRFQNENGTLTKEGRARYEVDSSGNMSKQGRKQYEHDKRMEDYRSASLMDIDNRSTALRRDLSNDINKYDRKIEKAQFKGKTKRVEKLQRKQDVRKVQLEYQNSLHELEKSKVMKMSLEELSQENRAINGLAAGRTALSILASSAASYNNYNAAIIVGHDKDTNRQARRITAEERFQLQKKAEDKIKKEAEARKIK